MRELEEAKRHKDRKAAHKGREQVVASYNRPKEAREEAGTNKDSGGWTVENSTSLCSLDRKVARMDGYMELGVPYSLVGMGCNHRYSSFAELRQPTRCQSMVLYFMSSTHLGWVMGHF